MKEYLSQTDEINSIHKS